MRRGRLSLWPMKCYASLMAAMISEVYRAFIAAGVPEEAARQAAEALSSENLATKKDALNLQSQMNPVKWMVGFNLVFSMAILWRLIA